MVDATSELRMGVKAPPPRPPRDWSGLEPDDRAGDDEATQPKSRLKGRLLAGGLAAMLLIPFGLGLSSRFSGGEPSVPAGPTIGTPYTAQSLSVVGTPLRGPANITGVMPGLSSGGDVTHAPIPGPDLMPDTLKVLEDRLAQSERRLLDAEKRIAAAESAGSANAAQALSSTTQSGDLRSALGDIRKDLGELALRHDAALESLVHDVAALRKAPPPVRSEQATSRPALKAKARSVPVAPAAKGCSLRGVMAALRDGEPAAWIALGSGEAHTYRVGDAVKCLGRITEIEPGVTGGVVRGTLGVLRE